VAATDRKQPAPLVAPILKIDVTTGDALSVFLEEIPGQLDAFTVPSPNTPTGSALNLIGPYLGSGCICERKIYSPVLDIDIIDPCKIDPIAP
jgi:hypothetical protein